MEEEGFIHQYLDQMKLNQKTLLDFLEDEENEGDDFDHLINYFDDLNIRNDRHILKELLHLISNISDNHNRTPNFLSKIERILKTYQKEINKNISNFSLFNIFKKNKRILFFLLRSHMLIAEKSISLIISEDKYKEYYYPHYFYNEFKYYFDKNLCQEIDLELEEIGTTNFDQRREIGENDLYICQLIRNGSIDDFITLVNRKNISLNTIIKPDIFETNPFLLKKKETSLIEYATFFGSFQVFKYLQLNNVILTPSLWLYAIHGKNPELIHILEENDVEPDDKNFVECYIETVKCHHIDFMNYILENCYKIENEENFLAFPLFYNFFSISDQFTVINRNNFFDFCKYDYFKIVDFLVKNKLIESLQLKGIQKNFLFLMK